MKRRFTPQELYELRNTIPIHALIAHLKVPNKTSEGYFRFLCPRCGEFNTGISQQTNLAWCFACKQRFNTIEIIMDITGLAFVESVKQLQVLRPMLVANPAVTVAKESRQMKTPVAIGEILARLRT